MIQKDECVVIKIIYTALLNGTNYYTRALYIVIIYVATTRMRNQKETIYISMKQLEKKGKDFGEKESKERTRDGEGLCLRECRIGVFLI